MKQDSFMWPSGSIVSNVEDVMKWLSANISKATIDSSLHFMHLAHSPLEDSIRPSHAPPEKYSATQGIIWWHLKDEENERILWHGGTTPDHTIIIALDKKNRKTVIVYINISCPLIQNEDKTLKTNSLALELLKL